MTNNVLNDLYNVISDRKINPEEGSYTCYLFSQGIDKILKNAEVVDDDDVDSNVINVGCTVKIKDLEFKEEMEYKIVGSTEANSLKGKISNESPVGKALIGAQKGDTVEVETPAGMIKYKIVDFRKN